MQKKVTGKRHVAKAITWRLLGTLDTITISWIVTGNPFAGLKIGFSETITKMFLYYLHERIWLKVDLSRNKELQESKFRHLLKTITWRVVGTLDTMLLSWIITGNPTAALKIAGIELITKMTLYYIHERLWYKSNYGIEEISENQVTHE